MEILNLNNSIMKKLILSAAAVVLLAVPAAQAQKINKEAVTARLVKCDADAADAKKGAKASTWMNRGKAYYEALEAPTKNLAENVDRNMFELLVGGKPKQTGTETVSGKECTTLVYPYFTAYVLDGKVFGWKQTREIQRGLLRETLKSYAKAYELDPKQKAKIREALDNVVNFCSKKANNCIAVGDYKTASEAFAQAYDVQSVPVYDSADAEYLFLAGRLATVEGQNDAEMFKKGADYLERALKAGYCDEEGSLYYYLFHCYYGQRADDKAFILKSRDALLEGIAKYPKNELILDGLMNLYTAEEGVGDPKDLVGMIDEAIASDPENIDLWYGRGRVYFKLQNYDECIASFKEVVKLRPEDAQGFYLLGVFYMSKAEALLNEINERHYTSQAEYDKDSEAAVAMYKDALPYLEKAIELNPDDANSVELVKQIYFRFRDEEGNQAKYEYYNNRLNELRQ